MTPEEKAQELVYKFTDYVNTQGFVPDLQLLNAKSCANICCDEVMAVLEKADEDRGRKEEFRPLAEYGYWDTVKTHIQSL